MQLVQPPTPPKNDLSIYHGIKKDFKISGGRVELLLQFSPCSLLDEGKVRGMCFCPWLSLLSLEKPKELGCHTSNLGTCACVVVWRVGGWVGGVLPKPSPSPPSHGEGGKTVRSHTCLHNTWQLITQPTPS